MGKQSTCDVFSRDVYIRDWQGVRPCTPYRAVIAEAVCGELESPAPFVPDVLLLPLNEDPPPEFCWERYRYRCSGWKGQVAGQC